MDIQDLTQLPNTRQEAIQLGYKYYFTGKPCKHGHFCKKRTKDSNCTVCSDLRSENYKNKNVLKVSEREKKYRETNKKRIQKYMEQYRKDNKERIKIYESRRRSNFSQEVRFIRNENAKMRYCLWYINNKEEAKLRRKKWAEKNKDLIRVLTLNRISRKKNAEGKFFKKDILIKLELQNNKCVYCKCDVSISYHVDHIMPLYRGGSNWPDNLQILCPSCNCSKGAKTHDEFIEFLQKQKSVQGSVNLGNA